MTYRHWLERNAPDKLKSTYGGGAYGCPLDKRSDDCFKRVNDGIEMNCYDCWDQEMPDTLDLDSGVKEKQQTETDDADMEACPFCNAKITNYSITWSGSVPVAMKVHCYECGASIEIPETFVGIEDPLSAIRRWNMRGGMNGTAKSN